MPSTPLVSCSCIIPPNLQFPAQGVLSMLTPRRHSHPSNNTLIHTDKQLLLTKGDNNYMDDIQLYQGLDWLERKHIVGKVQG
jgi:hypothetical protein